MPASVDPGTREGESPSAFMPTLKALVAAVPGATGAIFADRDGECVDYYSRMDPFELKVIAAHAALVLRFLAGSRLGVPSRLGISGTRLTLWIAPLGEQYTLVLVMERRAWASDLDDALDTAIADLRAEAGLDPL